MKKRFSACLMTACMILCTSGVWLIQSRASAATAYNTVRVKISTAESTSISITVGNDYRIAQDPSAILSSGTYTVSISGGNIKISNGSFSQTFGTTMTLERCKSDTVNTIKLYNTRYDCNISYLGNMAFSVAGSGVRVINTVPIEQYLYGVIGYEMSDAFPIESLKAQAVAARGYVINDLSPGDSYDIGDTSADQVYRGYPSSLTNVIAAVDATRGQVMTYNGTICQTYFSASNGGVTELPGNAWGGGESKNATFPYLGQKTDPYDLENTSSLSYRVYVPKVIRNTSMDPVSDLPSSGVAYKVQIVNVNRSSSVYATASTSGSVLGVANKDLKFTWIADSGDFYKIDFSGSTGYVSKSVSIKVPDSSVEPTSKKPSLPIVYKAGDKNTLLSEMQAKAYVIMRERGDAVPDVNNIRLLQVTAFRNGTPRYSIGNSNCYVSADADLVVQYIDSDGNLVDSATVTVSVALMQKDSGGNYVLTHDYINDNCRMRFVEATADGFDIVNRRFGHGVGLSQRGAQQMAFDGKDYNFILGFYYGGATLSTVDTTIPTLPVATLQPTGKIVRITGNPVNIRSQPSTSASTLGQAKKGVEFTHLGQTGSWYIISYNNKIAYVSTGYSTLVTPTPTPTITPTPAVTPTPVTTPTPVITPTPTPAATQVITIKVSTYVNIRKTASTSAVSLGKAYNGEKYAYLGKSGSFWKITYKGQTGYVYSTYGVLTSVSTTPTQSVSPSPTATATATPTPTPTATPTSGGSTVQLIRVKVSSYVKVRKTASTSASSIGSAYNNETYLYLGKSGSFWKVNYKGQTGYIYSTYGVQTSALAVKVSVGSYVTVRSSASTSASSLGKAYNNETFTYLGKSGSFLKITYKGKTGYISATYGTVL